jgi:hypothetical protein
MIDPYMIMRFILINNIDTVAAFNYMTNALKLGFSPFIKISNEIPHSLFEIAANQHPSPISLIYLKLFIYKWGLNPDWSMHDEIYKCHQKKEILRYIDSILLTMKDRNPIINQVLNITHLALLNGKV